MSWSTVRLGDVADVLPGFAFSSKEWSSSGVPVVKIKNIRGDGSVEMDDADCVSEKFLSGKTVRFKIDAGDYLIAMTGATAGKVGMYRERVSALLNQRVAKLAPTKMDSRFFWSVISSQEYQEAFFRLADGAAQPNMSGGQIEGILLPNPPLPTQRKIAALLSAYDDLIENNTRRVRVLEDMARALYREWFVEYRYPGHENAEFVEDEQGRRPKGWEWQELRYLLDVKYGKTLPKTKIHSEGAFPVYGAGDIIGFYDQKIEDQKVVLVTSRGAGSGHVWRTRSPAFITNNALIVKPNLLSRHFSYAFIQYFLESANLMSVVTGAAQPQMTIENLGFASGLVPEKTLVENFNSFVLPLNETVDSLILRNDNLRRTRDLLLPRLVSGELDVSELDIRGAAEDVVAAAEAVA